MVPSLIALGVLFALVMFFAGIRILRPTERGLVERFGKYKRFASPGFNWIIPCFERLIRINITEQMVDAQKQSIITADNLNAEVDAQVYFKVRSDEESIKASQYNVNDYFCQIVNLARSTLRNIIGNLPFREANSDRNKINKELMIHLQNETNAWGLDIVRTELKEIDPPGDVQTAMNNVIKAENEKIAALDFATAVETKADGERRAAIKRAEGERQARILKAEGVAEAIKLENEAILKHFKDNAIKYKELEVTQNSLEKNTKIVLTEKGIRPVLVMGDDTNVMPFPDEELEERSA